MSIFIKSKQFHYRVDTFLFLDQSELEDGINNIASTELFEGRWRLHSIDLQRANESDYGQALTIFEREIR